MLFSPIRGRSEGAENARQIIGSMPSPVLYVGLALFLVLYHGLIQRLLIKDISTAD